MAFPSSWEALLPPDVVLNPEPAWRESWGGTGRGGRCSQGADLGRWGPGLLAAFPGEPLTRPSLHSPTDRRPGGKVKINAGWRLAEFLFPVTKMPYHPGPLRVQWAAKDCF